MHAMPRLVFTPQLRRVLAVPDVLCDALDLRGALQQVFAQNPHLGPYVLDDQGHLRPNVMVFIDGQRCRERVQLADALRPDSTVHVMQALSGG